MSQDMNQTLFERLSKLEEDLKVKEEQVRQRSFRRVSYMSH